MSLLFFCAIKHFMNLMQMKKIIGIDMLYDEFIEDNRGGDFN